MLLSSLSLCFLNLAWPNSPHLVDYKVPTPFLKSCHPHSVEGTCFGCWGHQLPPKPMSKWGHASCDGRDYSSFLHLAWIPGAFNLLSCGVRGPFPEQMLACSSSKLTGCQKLRLNPRLHSWHPLVLSQESCSCRMNGAIGWFEGHGSWMAQNPPI